MDRLAMAWIAILALAPGVHAARLTVGEEVPRVLETPHPYGFENRVEPVLVWSETLHHSSATYIAPHFTRFELAEGDHVIVRSVDGKQSWRYTGRGKPGVLRDGFWSGHIKGRTAVIELFSRNAVGRYGFLVERFARGLTTKEVHEANGIDSRAICGADDSDWARCYAASEPEIYQRSRAVARLIVNGTSGCSGWLVGGEGHLLTSHECIENATDAMNTDYEFLAEGATCATDCSSFGACPGIVEVDTGTLIKTNAALDYSLVLLPTDLTPTYGFLRMRDTGPLLDERIYVPQHPASWGKRIAVVSSDASDQSGFCEISSVAEPACTGGGVDVGYFADTQSGSSGSPVIAYDDHRVVSVHHCADCANRGINVVDVIADLGPDLPQGAAEQLDGTVEIERQFYACSASPVVTVRDDSIRGAGSQAVTVQSSTETTPESLTLLETGPSTGRFTASIAVSDMGPTPGDGIVTVAHGDTITVEYVDADDGQGGMNIVLQATASVDCVAPLISNVAATEVGGSTAKITWQTDELADSLVNHGLVPPGSSTTTDAELSTDHGVTLLQLQECSTHFYSVESADAAGNVASDDNGGLFYTFETGHDNQPSSDSADTPLPIPDDDVDGAISTISVTADSPVLDVDVRVNISHTFDADLTLALIPPSGPPITLANRRGGDGDDYFDTLFDDEAGSSIASGWPPFAGAFRPEQPLSGADGILSAGDWQLRVVDQAAGDIGNIESWTLVLTFPAAAVCGTHARFESHSLEVDACPTGGPGSGNGFGDAGEQVQLGVTLRNDGTDPLSGVSARLIPQTAGLTMFDDTAVLGNMAAGSTTAPLFIAQLPGGAACGDPLLFDVEINSNEGLFLDTFSTIVGEIANGQGTALDETFDAGIPGTWIVSDGSSDGNTWYADNATDPAGCANADPNPPIGGAWAAVDSDCAGSVDMDESLTTPLLDLGGAIAATLEFDHYFNQHTSNQAELAEVDVRSALTAGAWVNVAQWTSDTANPDHALLDITAQAAGAADAQVRWRYHNANFEWFWYVDNALVTFVTPGPCNMTACAPGPPGPPPVPDGSGPDQPLLADRVDAPGTQLSLSWDTPCTATSTHLLFGPLDQVASYALAGSECTIATPFTWNVGAGGDLWFVVVNGDGVAVEGSWGRTSGGERNGLSASGECGVTVRDLSGTCP